jgi:pSer/pThr/pTyr-binding forkhead associated (FHA) protein
VLTRDLRGSRIQDLGSANGTRVNGTRLPPGVDWNLHEGDRLRFGEVEAVYLEAVATASTAQ